MYNNKLWMGASNEHSKVDKVLLNKNFSIKALPKRLVERVLQKRFKTYSKPAVGRNEIPKY